MNWGDKEKVIKKGFIIIREWEYNQISDGESIELPYRIYYCSGNSSWELLGNHKYRTKALRRVAMDKLLKSEKIIED